MNKIVWVFGESATGKETFIRNAISNPSSEIMLDLGYNNKNLFIIEESISNISSTIGGSDVFKRVQIIDKVKEIVNNGDNFIIFIKGQSADLYKKYGDVVRTLDSQVPNVEKEIIYLNVDSDILYERCTRKFWWPESNYSKDQMNKWVEQQKYDVMSLLPLGFKIIDVDSTNGYEMMNNKKK